MELRIYTPDLSFCGVIDDFKSFIVVDKYFSPGTVELHLPVTESNLRYARMENLIQIPGQDAAAVIESCVLDDTDREVTMVVKGRFLSSYLDRRLIKGTVNFSGTTEAAMYQLVGGATPIPLLEADELQGFEETVQFQVTYKNLLTYQEKLAKSAAYGFRIRPDFKRKKLLFQVYRGADRSEAQRINNRVIFSEKFDSLQGTRYEEDTTLYKNVAFVGGAGEGDERIIVQVGEATGLELRELFVDARDLQQGELTAEAYSAALEQRGTEKLNAAAVAASFECDVGDGGNYVYNRDYFLGDIVTIQKTAWGMAVNRRITEVREVWENGHHSAEPTLGEPLPESIDWSDT